MLIYSIVHVELARQREQNVLAAADRHRHLADAQSRLSRSQTRGSTAEATGRTHFAHRESGGVVVDLFWDRRRLENDFRVEVADRRSGTRFVLHPVTGKAAIQAFYHPFATSGVPSDEEAWAA